MRAPLFLSNVEALKPRLRLSGMSEHKDIADLLDEALSAARFRFYADLGITCVTALLAFTPEENPTSEEGLLRDLAGLTEVRLVRKELLDLAPVLFVDSAGKVLDVWNEANAQPGSSFEVSDLRDRWELTIKDAMDILRDKALPDPITVGRATCRVWTSEPREETSSAYC